MKQVFKYDQNGFYVEPVILQDNEIIPADCTEIKPQDGLYKGKFINGAWVESLTNDEINALKNAPKQKTQLELIKDALDDLILGGAL